jgi:hypothetical protein
MRARNGELNTRVFASGFRGKLTSRPIGKRRASDSFFGAVTGFRAVSTNLFCGSRIVVTHLAGLKFSSTGLDMIVARFAASFRFVGTTQEILEYSRTLALPSALDSIFFCLLQLILGVSGLLCPLALSPLSTLIHLLAHRIISSYSSRERI